MHKSKTKTKPKTKHLRKQTKRAGAFFANYPTATAPPLSPNSISRPLSQHGIGQLMHTMNALSKSMWDDKNAIHKMHFDIQRLQQTVLDDKNAIHTMHFDLQRLQREHDVLKKSKFQPFKSV